MATYFVSDFNTGTPPSGWTKRWNTTPTWTGANPLAIPVGNNNDWVGLTLDSVDSDSTRADVELLVKWTTQGTLATSRIFTLRGAGADESATHYHFSYVTSSQQSVGYCAGSDTRTNIQTASFTFAASTTYWTRFRVNGSTLRVRTWADGGSEPGTWDIDTTDSNVTAAGWVGFSTNVSSAGPTIHQIGVGTNGDTAPASGTTGQTVAVPAGSLSLTGYAPTVTATANQTVAVPAGTLTLTAYAPAAVASNNQTVSVPAGALTLTGYAPDVQVAATGTTVQVPAATLSLTGFAPVVVAPATIAIPAGSLTLTGFAPSVAVRADQVIAVPLGELTLTGYAPTVATTGIVSVPVGSLTLTGYAPIVTNGEAASQLAGRVVRRRRTKFQPAPIEAVEREGEDEPKTTTLVPQEAMQLLMQEAKAEAGNAIKKARVASVKRRMRIEQEDERAIERALLDWF